ncbi:MAG: non-canonical purine pyrophosphatase, partial [Bacteroidetes bacterium]|nr:non-canonical purine pyrophosphatase [Bacteroidota bacterium]
MDLVFASSNKNKIKEISSILPQRFQLKGLSDIGITEEIPEPGTTIRENSFLKAKFVSDFLNKQEACIFADDSGLEVEALNGAPGVY